MRLGVYLFFCEKPMGETMFYNVNTHQEFRLQFLVVVLPNNRLYISQVDLRTFHETLLA